MKKNEKKNRPRSRQHKDKKKAATNRKTKSSHSKKSKSKRRSSNSKPTGTNKRGQRKHTPQARKQTQREKEIYRTLISLVEADEKLERQLKRKKKKAVKPAKARKLRYKKGRGENLFEIDLSEYVSLADKIEAVRLDPFENVIRFLKRQPIEPAYVNVTFRDVNEESGEEFFEAYLSPPSMVVDADNTKQFILESIVEHNDNNILRILERYDDDNFTPNELESISFRFLFPF